MGIVKPSCPPHDGETVTSAYYQLLSKKKVSSDPAQVEAVGLLQSLQDALHKERKANFWQRFLPSSPPLVQGIYLHGSVGRGKSMLMDLFYTTTTIKHKRRIHFHAFMLEIHKELYKWRNENKHNTHIYDPLPYIAKMVAATSRLLCFDELQVTDITDAMLLGRLFTQLFALGVIVVATSNRAPDELYKDGLQREHFIPFIHILKEHAKVFELKGSKDYRLGHIKSLATVYFTPLGKKADKFIAKTFSELTNDLAPVPTTLSVKGRKVTIGKTCGDIAWTSFHELCAQPLGAEDYIEIAREFSTLLLTGIPQLSPEHRNEARRFVTLIDILYEHKVDLICSAAVPCQSLYVKGDGHFEFARTVSRLIEMQSEAYLSAEHVA